MSKDKKQQGYIKTESTLLIAFIALTIGFVSGVVFGVYKSGATPAVPRGNGIPPTANASAEQEAEIETLKQLALKNPQNVENWIQLGHLYFDTGQIKKAISAYEKSLEIAPDNPDVITDLGVMYRRDGNPKEAVAKFDQAIKIDPKHQVSRFNKGIVLMHDFNDAAAAVEAWRDLVKVNPDAKTPNGQLVSEFISQFEKQKAK